VEKRILRSAPRRAAPPGLLATARTLAAFAAHLVFPRGCAACDAPLRARAAFCASCAASVEVRAGSPAGGFGDGAVVAAASYGGALAQALHRLKYCGRVDVAPQLGDLLARAAHGARFDLVVPVPLHPIRLAERGFNQAALLARPLVQGRFAPEVLARARPTPQQTRLARAERAKNMSGAFRGRVDRLRGARVLLVDDVVTTGATLAACRAALLDAGAAEVSALVVARAD
jgi:ComF family protein